MIRWPLALAAHEAEICGGPDDGPGDEFDDAVNGDPDSRLGEEDESGFDEMSPEVGWQDEAPSDDGLDDAEPVEEEDDEAEDDDAEADVAG